MGRAVPLPKTGPESVRSHRAMAAMAAETRVRRGHVGNALDGATVAPGSWAIGHDAFLLRTPDGIALQYRRGEGVTLDAPDDADPRDIRLWREGTLHAAVAALNGLIPLHASAVAHRGRVYAFTGPAGAGKSTLVAALGRAGFVHFCDDTLILDPSGSGPPLCLPGHKRTKLWLEGARLAGVEPGERVASDYAKHMVAPSAGFATEPLPLGCLFVLGTYDAPAFAAIGAGEKIAVLEGDHYTAELWRKAGRLSRPARFAELAALAERIAMTRFERPFDPGRFAEGIAAAAAYIGSQP